MFAIRRITIAALAALIALPACSIRDRNGPFESWIKAEDERLWREDLTVDDSKDSPQSSDTSIDSPELSMAMSVDDYVQLALERNPAILVAERRVASTAQRIPQATSLEDPMFEVVPIGEMAETVAGMVGLMAGVSQKLPLGGKLGAAGELAQRETAMALAELEAVRLDVAAETRRAFWILYESARAQETIDTSRALLAQIREAAEAQYRAGVASQQDVLQVAVELGELDSRLIAIEQRSTTAKSMLNRLLGRAIDASIPLPPESPMPDAKLNAEAMFAKALERNPALRGVREQIEAERQRVKLARSQRIPDLTLMADYAAVDDEGMSMIADGSDQWSIGFGVNLPIWAERLSAAEREARLGVLQGLGTLADEHNRIAFELADTLARIDSARRRAIVFRDQIMPQINQTIDASMSSYRAGSIAFTAVADNWRRQLDIELMYHEAVAELNTQLAELERLMGGQPDHAQPAAEEEQGS